MSGAVDHASGAVLTRDDVRADAKTPSAVPEDQAAKLAGAPPPGPTLRSVVVRAVILALMLLAAGLFIVNWNELLLSATTQATNDAYLRGDPTQLSARVSGYVRREGVTDFQAVKAGDVLYEIEDDDYRARVDQAQAGLDAANATVSVLEAQIGLQRQVVAVASSQIAATEADLDLAGKERARQAALLNTEGGLRRAWETAVADEQRLQAMLASNRATLGEQTAQLGVLGAQLEQARAIAQTRQAALALARIDLGYTRVVAPRDGVVGQRQARAGQFVKPGAPLITLVPLDDVWAVANFREIQLRNIHPGQPATVTVDAYPGVVLHGRVLSLEPGTEARSSLLPPDHATGNFTYVVQRVPVRIGLEPGTLAGRLRPGLSVEARIDTQAR